MMMASEMSTLSLGAEELEPQPETEPEEVNTGAHKTYKMYNTLCHVCQDTIERGVRSWKHTSALPSVRVYDPRNQHHRSLKSLWESLFTDCYVCNTFCERISPWARALILERLDTRSALGWDGADLGQGDWAPLVTGIEFRPSNDETAECYYWLTVRLEEDHINFQSPISDDKGQEVGVKLILDGKKYHTQDTTSSSASTQSPEVFALAKRWISNCVDHHARCKGLHSEQRGWYPTRLLDLSPPDLAPSNSIRLIETKDTAPSGRYMTLSHCWGRVDHLTLTKATYAELASGIATTRLRPIFQDAVCAARSLGARYLWIDALCIFQDRDDLSDWNCEAPAMQHVYSNSLCNLSAVNAPDGSHALFHARDPGSLSLPTVRVADADGSTDRVDAGPTEQFVFHDDRFWQQQVSRAILHTRAWVVQERLLAPRVLHFGARHVLWECAEMNAAESYPEGLPDCIPTETAKGSLAIPAPGALHAASFGPEQCVETWSEVVRIYTMCSLTQPGDKLIACAGLAKRIAAVSRDEYVAGLWRRQLEYQLLWEVAANAFPRRRQIGDTSRPERYRAPSWSWASLDGPVRLPHFPAAAALMAQVADVRVEHEGSDRYGAVRSARLRLVGMLRAINIHEPYQAPNQRLALTWRIQLRGASVEALSHHSFRLDVMQPHFHAENAAGSLFMMPLALSPQEWGHDVDLHGLLLQVVDAAAGVYRRIGVAKWWIKASERAEQEGIFSKPDARCEAPCVDYEGGFYSIMVV
jgi:hypothetical protein